MIPDADKALYARQILLSELGLAGQARLAASRVRFAAESDARVSEVARDYLLRAGVGSAAEPDRSLAAMSCGDVAACAGTPELEACAAWLLGAWTAVEAIKASAGIAAPVALSAEFSLVVEVG
ncbi:MAG TPA: hypothetical protein VJR89_12880 [Polyangiales bacterium]|nr:hypothetical protein [Polyangiales bacterium]